MGALSCKSRNLNGNSRRAVMKQCACCFVTLRSVELPLLCLATACYIKSYIFLDLCITPRQDEGTSIILPDGSLATGLDACRSYILTLSHHYWPSTEELKDWLSSWDEWETEQPRWFTDSNIDFQNRIAKHAPAEALPRTVLVKILSEA